MDVQQQQVWADKLAAPMFSLSVLFLGLLAASIVAWVDIPRVAELAVISSNECAPSEAVTDTAAQDPKLIALNALVAKSEKVGNILLRCLAFLWLLFWVEFIFNVVIGSINFQAKKNWLYPLVCCLIPPLRLGLSSRVWGDRVWLPMLSWQHSGKSLSSMLDRFFTKPMLIIALLILPILLLEFGLKTYVEEHDWLRMLLHVSTGFIWFAFAFEFIIMLSATDKNLQYIKKHWLDLAIILLPLISFLRTVRVLRLAKLAKVQKLTALSRVYRVRGLGMKALRALMVFGVINRLFRVTPESVLKKLQTQREDMQHEMDDLNARIAKMEDRLNQAQS